jgi:hypothetical protein
MSHFIIGPMVDNEPLWMSKHINDMTSQELATCATYQKLIKQGYFPPDNYFATKLADLKQWADNDIMMSSEQIVWIMSMAIKKGMSK